jgi:hypothetical protein
MYQWIWDKGNKPDDWKVRVVNALRFQSTKEKSSHWHVMGRVWERKRSFFKLFKMGLFFKPRQKLIFFLLGEGLHLPFSFSSSSLFLQPPWHCNGWKIPAMTTARLLLKDGIQPYHAITIPMKLMSSSRGPAVHLAPLATNSPCKTAHRRDQRRDLSIPFWRIGNYTPCTTNHKRFY